MEYNLEIANALKNFRHARDFERCFSEAEHTIVESKRDIDPDGWQAVHEWISRAQLYDRYAIWLVVAIEISADGVVSAIEDPELFVIEVDQPDECDEDAEDQAWQLSIGQFDEGGWDAFVENGGSFEAMEIDLTKVEPFDRFNEFWNSSKPDQREFPSDAIALKAPMRFMI